MCDIAFYLIENRATFAIFIVSCLILEHFFPSSLNPILYFRGII